MKLRSLRILLFLLALLFAAWETSAQRSQAESKADSFARLVQPVLTEHCLHCHNARTKKGGLDLSAFRSTSDVSKERERWELVAQKLRSGEMPPSGMPRPAPQQIKAVTNWLEALFARLDRNSKPDPGRVTARRLNRAEYNNTVRDLLAVNFRPADDFPADDAGYGFDNIGDVLSLSPLLLEKYLAAAEQLARKVIPEHTILKPSVERYRPDRLQNFTLAERAAQVMHDFPVMAEYDLQADISGSNLPTEQPPVKVTIWLNGQQLQTVEFDRRQPKPWLATARTQVAAGQQQIKFTISYDGERPELTDKTRAPLGFNAVQVRGPFNQAPPSATESYKRVFTCGHAYGQHQPTCTNKILTDLARRAYRRSVTTQEVAALANFVALAQREGDSFEQGVRVALQAALVSPHFLFRNEQDQTQAVHRLNDYELASRLSYFLWSSMPDDELLRLAGAGRLQQPVVLKTQVLRMLRDAKAAALVENFGGQWLQLRNLASVTPDPDRFPNFTPELREAMRRETELFFTAIIQEDRSIIDFLDARYTFLNETLARHYGIAGVTGPEFRRVTLDGTQRSGVLTQASILTVSSYPTRTSPVIRGKWILENFLNAPPPPPPDDVPTLDEKAIGLTGSLRRQFEQHRANPTCAACHARMDPLGFGLENYDAIGAWRTKDGKFPVDATGTLPDGRSFQTPGELKAILQADRDAFAQCLTEKLLTYALGRGLERYDKPAVQKIARNVAANNYRFSRLVLEIAQSLPFQMRRGEAGKLAENLKQHR